jgi:hypothetical protein
MRIRLLWLALLCLGGSLVVAAPKTYPVHLGYALMLGDVQLQPGDYKLKIEGTTATLVDPESKAYKVTVKIATESRKYERTTVVTISPLKDEPRIKAIEIGGSNIRVEFE